MKQRQHPDKLRTGSAGAWQQRQRAAEMMTASAGAACVQEVKADLAGSLIKPVGETGSSSRRRQQELRQRRQEGHHVEPLV